MVSRNTIILGFLIFETFILNAQKTNIPNVVVVMADDIGLCDLSFYSRQFLGKEDVPVKTPNIDDLANMGMRFSDAHSPASLCAPSRFSMMTGNYSYRNKSPQGVWNCDADPLIDPDFTTIARIGQNAGYSTAFFGKWGLGGSWESKEHTYDQLSHGALSYGFDYAVEIPEGIQEPPYALYENRKWLKMKKSSVLQHIPIEQTGYNLELDQKAKDRDGMGDSNWDPRRVGPILAQKAVSFIEDQANDSSQKPFFIYFWSEAIHTPHTPPKKLDGTKIAGTTPGPSGDMIVELDKQVGMLVNALKKNGEFENTLFIFTSDNGGLPGKWDPSLAAAGHRSNGNLKGQKGSIDEGGHRVTFIAVWPGKIKAGTEVHQPIVAHDVVATIATLTGQEVDRNIIKDSENLLPLFYGNETQSSRVLIHQSGGRTSYAIRQGDYKLIIDNNINNYPKNVLYWKRPAFEKENIKPIALYNLKDNIEEDNNLIDLPEYSSIAEEMYEKYIQLRMDGSPTVID